MEGLEEKAPVQGLEAEAQPVKRLIDIERAPLEYGRATAEGLSKLIAGPWPEVFGKERARRDEGRFASPQSFWAVWNKAEATVFADMYTKERARVLEDESGLKEEIERVKEQISPVILKAEEEKGEFFVPYNADPVTCRVRETEAGGQVEYTDQARVGRATNEVLAKLAALSNFHGRMWDNPEAQKEFLKGTLGSPQTAEELTRNYRLARAIAVFGGLYLAKYGMEPTHSEHHMALAQLENMPGNLEVLKAEYERLTTQTP